jgi:hypothetical protein
MAQKTDDRGCVPLCRAHHNEQHLIGWREFLRLYDLDLEWWITRLSAKPRIYRTANGYAAAYQEDGWIELGPCLSMAVLRDVCREWLVDNVFLVK